MKKRLHFITDLYGLAVVLVVFGHSHPIHTGYPGILYNINTFLYKFHMPLFFLVAGILLVYTSSTHENKISAWWKERCAKLLLPYLVLTLAAWIPKTMLNQYMIDEMETSFINLIKIIFIPRAGIWGHFWFIPVYLVLILLGMCWIKVMKQIPQVCRTGVLLTAVILNLFPIPTAWLGIQDITENLLYIMLGISFSDRIIQRQDIKYGFIKGITGTLAALVLYFMIRKNIFAGFEQNFIVSLARGVLMNRITCLVMLYSMLCLGMAIAKQSFTLLDYIGEHAFTIYIYSWPIQAVIEFVITVVLKADWRISYPAMFFGGLAGPLVIWEIYSKKVKRNAFLDAMIGVK